jgi:predicted O-linked N-acetylglucosamine transferase (SPINDLY family)
VLKEHKRWARSLPAVPQLHPKASAPRDPNRPLRIGYMSADFRNHPIAFFLEPLLANHDRNRVHVTCYSDVLTPDAFTRRIQELASEWRSIGGMSDDEVARLIVADRIDILIDLHGHTAGNRLPVFAQKPARVQVSYLGYPATTGLPTNDYRVTDAICDPPGKTDEYYTEKLIRLPNTLACYAPPRDAPPVASAPSISSGNVTFGSFTNLAKISPESIALWARALRSIQNSRLMLMARGADGAQTRARLGATFANHGVQTSQLDIRGALGLADYLAAHSQVDVVLDTFPFNGHTTSCHALWMGVPIVTLSGDRFASRLGRSLLENLDLNDLVAESPDQFVTIAENLARDTDRVVSLRAAMRDRMTHSPLMDARALARAFEDAMFKLT